MSADTKTITLTAGQIRAARALLHISSERLAQMSGVSAVTIRRSEANEGPVTMMPANAEAVRHVLLDAGIEFIAQNGGGPGVRMREPRG